MKTLVRTAFVTLLLIWVSAVDLTAQMAPDLLGTWSGRIRARAENVYDPADTGSRNQRGRGSWRTDDFWMVTFVASGGDIAGTHHSIEYDERDRLEDGLVFPYQLEVTKLDGEKMEMEWGMGMDYRCEAELEFKDGGAKLEGDFVCRERSNERDIIEVVTRGNVELEPYERDGGGR